MRSVANFQTLTQIQRNAPLARKAAAQAVLARRMLGIPVKFRVDTEICGEGEPVEFVYEVVSGAVRTLKVLSDGRRKIGGFYFAGDVFGIESGNEHSRSAEALVASTVRVIKRQTLAQLAGEDRRLARELLTTAMHEAARAHRHALMLMMTAQERVGDFLLEMASRISVGDLVRLPMSRQDIADYLGLTMETVSRAITGLTAASTISMPYSRAIMLQNRSALEPDLAARAAM
jgi:CRP/FNR family nitrogen fixation transcriptional regulator